MSEGVKYDTSKPRWSLIPNGTLEEVIKVLEYGANKYSPDNWKKVPEMEVRYYDAAMRHIDSYWQGEYLDEESGQPHLAHAVCCLLFLMWAGVP
jgi:hypothetical protein